MKASPLPVGFLASTTGASCHRRPDADASAAPARPAVTTTSRRPPLRVRAADKARSRADDRWPAPASPTSAPASARLIFSPAAGKASAVATRASPDVSTHSGAAVPTAESSDRTGSRPATRGKLPETHTASAPAASRPARSTKFAQVAESTAETGSLATRTEPSTAETSTGHTRTASPGATAAATRSRPSLLARACMNSAPNSPSQVTAVARAPKPRANRATLRPLPPAVVKLSTARTVSSPSRRGTTIVWSMAGLGHTHTSRTTLLTPPLLYPQK